jgi:tetratricopeptide (TPR) repeat protein
MSLSGNLKTMDLAELLQWVTLGRKTGSLAFIRNKTKNSIFFRNGQIISSRSNEPTKQLGHFLLFKGKISEVQLKKALEIQLQTRTNLGKILVQQGFVSQQDVQQALISRTEEVIYDLFLWEDGYFHFTAEGYNLEELILINMDLNAIIFEGVRRKDEWDRIRNIFPTNDMVLSLRQGVDLKVLNLTPLHKKLLFLLTLQKTISEIILELHGSDFLVNYELFQLYEKGVIEVKEIRSTPTPARDPAALISKGVELMESRRYQEAIAIFQEILVLDPHNSWADEQIEHAERAICEDYYRSSIPAHKVPYFLVPESALMHQNLTHQEGFVASRINGTWDVKSIVMLSPLREIEILQVLDKLMKLNLIALK